ncbi:MAG: hypothetical protein OEZ02_00785 [Anaerolineae bacterium]|nr:hypothetical protein [Anaerolineae bacterium]
MSKRTKLWLGIFWGMLLAGCGGPATSVLLPENQVGTIVALTGEAMTVQAIVEGTRQALQPSETPPPTAFTLPTAAATATQPSSVYVEASNRIRFEAGGTRSSISQSIGGNMAHEYLIKVMAGQWMKVNLSPAAGALTLEIRGVTDGVVLQSNDTQLGAYMIPSTQDYSIKVISPGGSHTYTLNVMVPAWVTFDSGSNSKTIYGHVGANNTVDYLVGASYGQTLSLNVSTAGVQVALSVLGWSTGEPYLRYVAEATNWSMVLPASQTYQVSVVTIGPATDFTLVITITN